MKTYIKFLIKIYFTSLMYVNFDNVELGFYLKFTK